jgi:tetratricopeptide (TPR) repeat protein
MNISKEQHYAEEKGQLGFHALLQGNYDNAASMFSLAIEHLRAQANEEIYYALCLDGLGQALIGQQLFAEAEVPLRQALSLYEEKFLEDSFGRFSVLCHLGSANSEQELNDRAGMFYEQALTIGEKTLSDRPVVLAYACLEGYADVLWKLGRGAEATAIDERIKTILREAESST